MIAAIMPCWGRAEQTVRNVTRLLTTAGRVEWQLICAVDGDLNVMAMLDNILKAGDKPDNLFWRFIESEHGRNAGYWYALQNVTELSDATHFVNLANDLLPGRDWLARGLAAYRARFGEGDGLMGFNDGIHGPELSPHFLISRALLERYGGWPVQYRHNFGDMELCRRAQADGCYGKAAWAVLYHDHPITGGAHDAIYAAGDASQERDRALYEQRRANGWR